MQTSMSETKTPAQPAIKETQPPAEIAINLDNITVRFESRRSNVVAVKDFSLNIKRGEFITIVGPSGCGKSTLLKVIAGLVKPSDGNVMLLGNKVTKPQQNIGFVFQQAALLQWRGVLKNIMLQAEMRDMDMEKALARAHELINMTGLKGFEKAWPHELSGGMQQRVSICRALLHSPPVLLMDEPFGALDAMTREQMNMELYDIWKRTATTVMFVTHSIPEAIFLGQRVVVMTPRPGQLLELIDVDLPAERDYADTMSDKRFADQSHYLRDIFSNMKLH